MSITATITAETVLLVVNRKKNSTRTTTIKNTEIDFDKIVKPSTINSAGTVTTVVDILDGSTWSTQVVAYPTTAYHDYPANYTWSGTLSTTISGVQTCATETADQVFPWPSHPLLPKKIQTELDLDEDPRGW